MVFQTCLYKNESKNNFKILVLVPIELDSTTKLGIKMDADRH